MDLDLKTLINKLNLTCRKGLEEAANLCVTQTNYNVEIEHLLLKILDNAETDLHRILRYYEIDQNKVIRELTTAMETFKRGNSRTPALSPQITSVLQDSWVISSLHLGGATIRSGPMVLAMLDDDELRGMLVDSCPVLLQLPRETLRKDLKELIKGTGEDANPAPPLSDSGVVQTREDNGTALVATETPALDQYTIDLTDQARKGNLDPIQGRDFEIRQIVDILMRRRQNNPMLTGEA
ncbi:MAG TPA: type VI secretion system ATPase TssH, partial [Candidatus Latescibacteria bacterium]|nr:type VI secretion system ATPase TssH [Candidatus Latescibacterota bacterium]